MKNFLIKIFKNIDNIDRRIIYLLVVISLSLPLLMDLKISPAKMHTADAFFKEVQKINPKENKIVLIAADWGPNTKAENEPQTEVSIEHLMRRKIKFALISNTPYSAPFLKEIPLRVKKRIEEENKNIKIEYGKDWINLGYRPGTLIMIQALAKANDLKEVLKTDVYGTPIEDLKIMNGIKTIKDISMLMQFTGTTGLFNYWLQFFQNDSYTPPYLHGCTSITIPEAYTYFMSGQIKGLYEGIAGAAWYEELLSKKYPNRIPSDTLRIMTSLSFAHLIIIALIILGNVSTFVNFFIKEKKLKGENNK